MSIDISSPQWRNGIEFYGSKCHGEKPRGFIRIGLGSNGIGAIRRSTIQLIGLCGGSSPRNPALRALVRQNGVRSGQARAGQSNSKKILDGAAVGPQAATTTASIRHTSIS